MKRKRKASDKAKHGRRRSGQSRSSQDRRRLTPKGEKALDDSSNREDDTVSQSFKCPDKIHGFLKFWHEFVYFFSVHHLNRTQMAVLAVLYRHADPESGESRPSQRTIGKLIGVFHTHVCTALHQLEDKGIIEQVKRGDRTGRATIWKIIPPPVDEDKDESSKEGGTSARNLAGKKGGTSARNHGGTSARNHGGTSGRTVRHPEKKTREDTTPGKRGRGPRRGPARPRSRVSDEDEEAAADSSEEDVRESRQHRESAINALAEAEWAETPADIKKAWKRMGVDSQKCLKELAAMGLPWNQKAFRELRLMQKDGRFNEKGRSLTAFARHVAKDPRRNLQFRLQADDQDDLDDDQDDLDEDQEILTREERESLMRRRQEFLTRKEKKKGYGKKKGKRDEGDDVDNDEDDDDESRWQNSSDNVSRIYELNEARDAIDSVGSDPWDTY